MKTPAITESEWNVMEVFWKKSPLTASEACLQLKRTTGWANNTVRTLMMRLVDKGALTYIEDKKMARRYYPVEGRDKFVQIQSDTFLNRIFQGATKQLLIHFSTRANLTPEEVSELKLILEKSQSSTPSIPAGQSTHSHPS